MELTLVVLTIAFVMVASEAPLTDTYGPPSRSAAPAEIPSLASRSAAANQHGDPASVIIRYNGANGGSRKSSGSSASSGRTNGFNAPASSARTSSASAASAPSGRFSNSPSPANSFSAPRNTASNQYSAPSPQYGAPAPVYGPPASRSAPAPVYGPPSSRSNLQEDPLAEPANYQFTYEVQDLESGSEFSQEESRKEESAQGSYRVLLPDGVLQIVEYQADEQGFRPTITYEETNNIPSSRSSQGPYPASNQPQGPY